MSADGREADPGNILVRDGGLGYHHPTLLQRDLRRF
jgi:hypothetical protein